MPNAGETGAEQEAGLRLRRLAEIVERCPDAIIATDADRIVCDLNPAAESLFGFSRPELVGRSVEILIPDELRADARQRWQGLAREEWIDPFESERLHRDGTRIPVELRMLAVNVVGAPRTGAVIYRDLTARRAHERALAAQGRRLRTLAARPAPIPPAGAGRADGPGCRVDRALAMVRRNLGMQVAWVAEVAAEELIFHHLNGDYERFGLTPGCVVPRAETICDRVLAGEVPELIPDAGALPALGHVPRVRAGQVRGYIGVPVEMRDGRLWGTLCAVSDAPADELGDRDLAFLHALAALLGDQLDHDCAQAAHAQLQAELIAASALLAAADAREGVTGGRSQAVVELATGVALELGLGDRDLDAVQQVALLHDLGKVAIPDAVLHTPGPLAEEEWQMMREHPGIGARIIGSVAPLAHLADVVRATHERIDGTGYPDRRAGVEIPLVARIVFACDAYHAMRSDRPHRAAVSHAEACAELRRCAGFQFDAGVVGALLAVVGAVDALEGIELPGATRMH